MSTKIRSCDVFEAYVNEAWKGDKLIAPRMPQCTPDQFEAMWTRCDCLGGVYVVLNPDNKLCKIGMTKNISERVANLQTACGSRLELLLWIELEPGYDESPRFIENALHRILYDRRKFGEWFKITVRDVLAIRQVFHHIYGVHLEEHDCFSSVNDRVNLFKTLEL